MTALILILLTAGAHAESHSWASGNRLQLTNGAGDLSVEAGGETFEVQTELKQGKCVVTFGDKGKPSVLVEPEKRNGSCEMDVTVKMPAEASLVVELGAGDVEIEGLVGSAILQVGAGNVEIDAGSVRLELGAGNIDGSLAGESTVRVGAGNVELDGLSQAIEVIAGAGNVELTYDEAPQGRVEVTAGIGNVEIDLPDGTVIEADLPDTAKVKLETGDSKTRVQVQAGLGNVRVE